MKLSNWKNSLFWRISLGFLVILLLLGLSYVSITAYSAKNYFNETTQKLHANVAEHMLLEVTPFKGGKVNEEAVGKIMHSMMAVNPSLEVYLLSPQGDILKYVVLDKKVRLRSVDLNPVIAFIESNGEDFIAGDDPRSPGEQAIFSATSVIEGEQLLGYIYAVLDSEKYENISQALLSSYFLRLGTQGFVLTLLAAFLIGVVIIYLLTKKLQTINLSVRKFEEGDYTERISVKGHDELDSVSRTFNHMADTIVKNMEDLKQVDKLRRELIANVSHDLRSPLAVISGYIETMMMQDGELTEDTRREYLEIIHRSNDRLSRMVSDLFELSKLEAKQVEFKFEQFNLHELIQDTTMQYELMAKEKGLSIKTDFGDYAYVLADIAKIERVIQNLMDNALKYSNSNSSVLITTSLENEELRVSLENEGEVIDPVEIPKLFDRYYKKQRLKTQSTGLGLAIVKQIMDGHNAIITAEQPQPGRTIFSFVLPAA